MRRCLKVFYSLPLAGAKITQLLKQCPYGINDSSVQVGK